MLLHAFFDTQLRVQEEQGRCDSFYSLLWQFGESGLQTGGSHPGLDRQPCVPLPRAAHCGQLAAAGVGER